MNAGIRLCITLALLAGTPAFAAKPAAKPAGPMPSVRLRHLIDTTMEKMSDISNPKQTFNRTPLTSATAEFTASAQTAPPEKQPMYQAVLKILAILQDVVEEHAKAVTDLANSKSVHGPADTKDLEISNPQHHWDAAAVARANKAKENHVNGEAEKAALEKDNFFSKGALAAWTKRLGLLQDGIEQTYVAELVAEKQLAMAVSATPPPILPPAPKVAPIVASKPPKEKPTKVISASAQYSPVGTWKASNASYRSAILKEDNTVTGGKWADPWKWTGTWKWTDQSKGALTIDWKDGMKSDVIVSPDGQNMTGKNSNGHEATFTRSTSPPGT